MSPPANSALDLYTAPNTFPIFTPIIDNVKVTIPIKETADFLIFYRYEVIRITAS